VKDTAPSLEEFFPENLSLEDVKLRLNEMQDAWTKYLSKLDENEIERVFEYEALDSGSFRNTVDDILTQLHGHSLYHRGQISSLIRESGGKPVPTDYVYWTREAITK
jgi:uncharacterized damage-inducible protein DinB